MHYLLVPVQKWGPWRVGSKVSPCVPQEMSDSMAGDEPDLSVVQGTLGRSELNPSFFGRTFSLGVLLAKSLLTFL